MTGRDVGRVGAVAVLLAGVAMGLRSRGVFSCATNTAAATLSGNALSVVLSVTEGLAVVAFVVVMLLSRGTPEPAEDDELFPCRGCRGGSRRPPSCSPWARWPHP
jgi:hypothetical protein